jgi:2-oxo-3-hexenedioate decarboxylase
MVEPVARVIEAGADVAIDVGQPLLVERFAEPRCEPEIAFLLRGSLTGEHVTAAEVLAATEAVCPAIDVFNADRSGTGFVLGGQVTRPEGIDLRLTGVTLEKNGELVATAAGAAALGHPAASVACLVRTLAASGHGLAAGQVVLSGALTEAIPVAPGDVIVASFDRLGTIEVGCH